MSKPYIPSGLVKAWYNYKSWQLPWRKKFFRGFDLDGNTFYESYNPLTPNKLRRTVKYVKDGHYTDNNVTRMSFRVSQLISAQWMSWLRHTRATAPTIEELVQEVQRIQSTRSNALLIDQRWEEERARLKLQAPDVAAVKDQEKRADVMGEARKQSENSDYLPAPGTKDEKGEWQPEAWNPSAGRKPLRR